ncbi:MAG: DUF4129 domain-containing protein [Chloroflexi bacterium]|nr:DUF4129 domain-containing protein [Chloroflexota bacterium]
MQRETEESILLPGEDPFMLLIRGVFAFSWLLLPVLIFYFIVSPTFRKRIFRALVSLLWIYTFYLVFTRLRPDIFDLGGKVNLTPPGSAVASVSVADYVNTPPPWLIFVATLVFSILLVGLFMGIAWLVWHMGRRPPRRDPLERLAQQARDALESLRTGSDLRNTVMRCYSEMVQTLDEQRGVKRQMDMTPREFASQLEKVGLAGEHVRRLTQLFEDVRYGARNVGEDEESQAIACLNEIVDACRSPL